MTGVSVNTIRTKMRELAISSSSAPRKRQIGSQNRFKRTAKAAPAVTATIQMRVKMRFASFCSCRPMHCAESVLAPMANNCANAMMTLFTGESRLMDDSARSPT